MPVPASIPARPLALLWDLMRGFRGKYAWAIGFLFCFTALNYATPLVAGTAIDSALALRPPENVLSTTLVRWMGGAGYVRENLWLPALLMVGLTVLAGGFSFLKGRWAAVASEGIARRLKDRLYDHLQHLPASWHDRAETGDVIQRCTSDVETLRLALSTQVVDVSNALLLVLTAVPVMALLDGRMTLISLSLIIPIVLFGYFYIGKVRHLFKAVDEAEGQVTRVVQENLAGLRVVRAFARQSFEVDKFTAPNQQYRDRTLRLIRLMAWYWTASDFIVLVQQGLVLFAGAWFISQGTLSVGTLFTFLMFLNMLLWPVRQMGRTLTDFGKSLVALTRMGEILAVPPEAAPAAPLLPPEPAMGGIEVRNLVFQHGSGSAALNGVSFAVTPGQTMAIMGPSGSGKSTLMHLLVRLYEYEAGSILLDDRDIRGLDRGWLRRQFGVVMQEPFLYSKTIGENIRLGRPEANPEELAGAASKASIHDTVQQFPMGYDTRVGERGVTLSGGQRQRVALARALLQDAPVLLLDDALSAVDAETAAAILGALRSRHGKKTTLVIAHRLSTLAHADNILVLDEGRVVQQGTHGELIGVDGLYRRLWNIQNDHAAPVPVVMGGGLP